MPSSEIALYKINSFRIIQVVTSKMSHKKYSTVTLIFWFLSLICSVELSSSAEFQRKFVSVAFRHGDRSPKKKYLEEFTANMYSPKDFYPDGMAELTNLGKRREYQLGGNIRNEYNDFLGEYYIPSAIHAQSTDEDRTKASLELVMAGIFPPQGIQIWDGTLNWQPVVMDYVPKAFDTVLVPEDCPQYKEELERVRKLPEIVKKNEKFSGLMKNLTEWTGIEFNSTVLVRSLYKSWAALNSVGLKLPNWSTGLYPDGLVLDGAILEDETRNYNEKLKRLNGGMLLRNITDHMKNVIDGSDSELKMALYSCHEHNMVAFLNTLGLYKPEIPKHSSAVFIELLEKNNEYYASVFYYLGEPQERQQMHISGCGAVCPFKKFLELLGDVIPTDEDMKC